MVAHRRCSSSSSALHVALVFILVVPTASSSKDAADEAERMQAQLEAIRHQHEVMFEEADSDRDGKVTPKEFVSCEMMRGSGLREAEVHQAFADLDTDASSDVSLAEWLASFDDTSRTILEFDEEDGSRARPTREEELEYLTRQFGMLDLDQDLYLRGGELASLASKWNDHPLADRSKDRVEVEDLLWHYDQDLDHSISIQEYLLDGSHHQESRLGADQDGMPLYFEGNESHDEDDEEDESVGDGGSISRGKGQRLTEIAATAGGSGGGGRGSGGERKEAVWTVSPDDELRPRGSAPMMN